MCAVAAAAVLLVTAATSTAQTGALTRSEVDAAIALGERMDPQPYRLRHAGPADNPVVVAAVSTPFLRVAFLSRAAADRGERLLASDIDPRATEPLVYIAFRWYATVESEAAAPLAAAEPQVMMLPPAPRVPQFVAFTKDERRGAKRPIWIRKGAAVLESFGAKPPHDDIALAPATPRRGARGSSRSRRA